MFYLRIFLNRWIKFKFQKHVKLVLRLSTFPLVSLLVLIGVLDSFRLLPERLDEIFKLNLVVEMNVSYLAKGRFQYEDLFIPYCLAPHHQTDH